MGVRSGARDRQVDLEEEWVKKNFSDDFLLWVQMACTGGQRGHLDVKEGLLESHGVIKDGSCEDLPSVHYPQVEGELKCVIGAAASAFFHLGYKNLASQIDVAGQNEDRVLHSMDTVRKIVEESNPRMQAKKAKGRKVLPTFVLDDSM